MTWLIWRQHRGQALWAGLTIAALGALMLWVGQRAATALEPYRTAGCLNATNRANGIPAACRGLENFGPKFDYAIPVFELGVPLLLAVMGALVGAPLVAREIEQRTHLVAWSQSVPRRRWYATKVTLAGGGLLVAGLLAGFGNYRLQGPLTDGGLTTSRWPWFFSAALAPAGEALLAFALAVALGATLRRTVPAIGAALVSFLVLLMVTARGLQVLAPAGRTTPPRYSVPSDGWIYQGSSGPGVPYHPAEQFWPLQLTYLAILTALAATLLALGWRATRAA